MQYIVMNTNNKIMKKNNGKERIRNVRKGWSRGREYWGCKR